MKPVTRLPPNISRLILALPIMPWGKPGLTLGTAGFSADLSAGLSAADAALAAGAGTRDREGRGGTFQEQAAIASVRLGHHHSPAGFLSKAGNPSIVVGRGARRKPQHGRLHVGQVS